MLFLVNKIHSVFLISLVLLASAQKTANNGRDVGMPELERQNRITKQILEAFIQKKLGLTRSNVNAPSIFDILPTVKESEERPTRELVDEEVPPDPEPSEIQEFAEDDNLQSVESEQIDSVYSDEGRSKKYSSPAFENEIETHHYHEQYDSNYEYEDGNAQAYDSLSDEIETRCPSESVGAVPCPSPLLSRTPSPQEIIHESSIQEPQTNQIKSVVVEVPLGSTSAEAEGISVPQEILEVLGEAKNSEEKFGPKIPTEISERWGKILIEGLVKEQREALLAKCLIPENFQLAKAPKLNAEVVSILNESMKNRDKRLEKMQNQLGSGIAGLVNLTSELINKELSKIEIIKRLSEVSQVLLDLHYEDTMNRRRLIIPLLDKSFINIIQGVKREKLLFGDNLGENIKNTKSIERSSLQIKKAYVPQPSTSRGTVTASQGNSRAPPRPASAPGAARAPPLRARYYPTQPHQAPPPQGTRRPPVGPRRPRPPAQPQERRVRR